MRPVASLIALALVSVASQAAAEGPRRLEIAASAAYAAPVGSAERGSRVGDTTFGDMPVALDAGYRLTRFVGVALHARYGVAIPTLCQSTGDCESSLGSDVAIALGARFYTPRVGPVAPLVDCGLGYEWLTTRLASAGASSTRAYQGPVLFTLQISAPFRLAERWTIGPVAGASLGTFTTSRLETNVAALSGDVRERSMHAWLSLGVRFGFAL